MPKKKVNEDTEKKVSKKTRAPNGQGHIHKLDDNRYEWRQMVDGELRTLQAKTLSELQDRINKVANLPVIKNKTKVDDWFIRWLANYVEPLKSKATFEQYRTIYEQHIKPVIGKRKLSSIQQSDIQSVITKMNTKTIIREIKNKDGKVLRTIEKPGGLSTCTMKHARKIMHIAFEKAKKDKLIPENPVYPIDEIEIPNKQAKGQKTLLLEELGKIFSELKKSRWYIAFMFMLVTGLRRGELLALKWSDIDDEGNQIIVSESNGKYGPGDTKSREIHYVPLTLFATTLLNRQKEMLKKENNPSLKNIELKKNNLIFPAKNGEMMRGDSLFNVINRIGKKTGIHVSPHMFRHTFVYLSKGTISLSELQEALGHDESTTTLDLYGTMLSDKSNVAKKLNNVFDELEKKINDIEEENDKIIDFNSLRKKAK